ncbi:MAG: LysM peptidoglycan-binding domain-containing protein [Burkholderiaceae bacterium]|jgi:membrane-bound lytic murein transglycosylase D
MPRHHTLSFTLALTVLSGCASLSHNNSAPSGTSSPPDHPLASTVDPAQTAPLPESTSVALNPVELASPQLRTVDLTAHADDLWDRIRTGFAIPNMSAPEVVEQQAWYLSHQDFLQRSFERSSHYLYHVVEELHKRGMPTELALLPFIESAYNPMAYSRAHASGMWQFIPTTGKNYNLQQDRWHDERRDIVASTDAALNYLEALYEMHGDWTLALASYNWGEGAVKRAIDRNTAANRPTDYLSLNMPEQTRNYFPKLQALKNIIANPGAYGLVLPPIENEPYFVSVPRTRDIDVGTAARMADMPVEDFKALNPSFNRPVILASSDAAILLPADRVALFESNLKGNEGPLNTWAAYSVKRGERLDRVAEKFGMSLASLCEANGITSRTRVRPGQELLVQHHVALAVPRRLPEAQPFEPAENRILKVSYTPQAETPRHASTVYVVRSGDTLYSIAKHFGLTVAAIEAQNELKASALAKGQKLVLPSSLLASSQASPTKAKSH